MHEGTKYRKWLHRKFSNDWYRFFSYLFISSNFSQQICFPKKASYISPQEVAFPNFALKKVGKKKNKAIKSIKSTCSDLID